MVEFLSIIGALIHTSSQGQYIYFLVNKKIVLNKITWSIAALLMVLQAGTYYEIVSTSNPWIATTSIIVACSFVFIFLYAFFRGRYARLTSVDIFSLAIALVTIAVWQGAGEAVLAHLLLQLAIFVSFVPTIAGLVQGTLREKPSPWFIGSVAYTFVIAAVLMQSGISNWVALISPVFIGVVCNSVIGGLAVAQERGRLKVPQEAQ